MQMRNRLTIATAALLLASAQVAMAQTAPTTPSAEEAAAETAPSYGIVDFGFRGTSTTGDRARYERYRDLRTGANVNLALKKTTNNYWYNVNGMNVGYRDQNVNGLFANKRVKLTAFFDQTPLNYGLDGETKTPWVQTAPGVWTLPDATQLAVQNKTAVGVLCAPGLAAGATCTPATANLALAQTSIYRGLAQDFDLASRRDTTGVGLVYTAAKDVDFNVSFQSTKKSGYQPYGLSFAFVNANELPIQLDNRTNDIDLGMQWGSDQGMIRIAYDRSMFNQNISSVTWDNPIRLTNFNDGQPVSATDGPWDPSAYSNGNGAATGRLAMPPSNTFDMFSMTALAKLPAHSTLNGSVAFSSAKQNDPFIPWTTNAVIANPATYVVYPGLASFPQNSAQAQVDGMNATFNFTTRPVPWVGLTTRYRFNDHKNRTPEIDFGATVRFDGVPEPGPYETEQHSFTNSDFNADATFTPIPFAALKLGVGHDTYEHSERTFATLSETTVRASVDSTGNQYFTVRAKFERSRRTASGLNEEFDNEAGSQELARAYDDAERSRDRGTLLVTVTPLSFLDFNASYATGKDRYDEPEADFGLLDNTNHSVNVGVDVSPSKKVSFGANYGQDLYDSNQRSRTANPDCTVVAPICAAGAYNSWTDPNRDWTLANNEKVNNFDLYLDLIKAVPKTDVRFAYDYSDSNNAFVHDGPRVLALQTNAILTKGDTAPCPAGFSSCFEALPNVTNKWQRTTVSVNHSINRRIGVGAEYWYEKFDVNDFATINLPGTSTPRIDYLGSLTTGYADRPYTGSTGFVRLIVHF
jgi:hypothetical protein